MKPYRTGRKVSVNSGKFSLRISGDPTTGNLTPQETAIQDIARVEIDGADLSCPGSSVVAEERIDGC